jgi:DNA invertase Pin-like site-specific DNA recombinase
MLVGYARVSTLDQNPALQIAGLKAAGCERIFTEKASGAQRERPELQAALSYLRNGDTLVVWKLDRLARSIQQLLQTVDTLQTSGIELRSLTESIDTTTPSGRLVFHIFSALAEFERAVIRERTSAGLQAAKERGKKGGRPTQFGPKELAAAKALLADPEIRVADIAARLKISPATLYRHVPGGRSGMQTHE